MWKKIVAPILLFYFFALLQTSFFVHFSLFGVVPDLVFILYFGFTFYSIKKNQLLGNARVYEMVFLAITAGFFLDIFQLSYLGLSVLSFLIIGFALIRAQSALMNKDEGYPLSYFLSIFIISLLGYYLLLGLFLNYSSPINIFSFFSYKTFFSIIYDSLFAIVFFYLYRITNKINLPTRQLKLFR